MILPTSQIISGKKTSNRSPAVFPQNPYISSLDTEESLNLDDWLLNNVSKIKRLYPVQIHF